MKSTSLAHIALFSVALIYGANYSIAKEVLDKEYIQPIGFISLRIIAALILFSFFHLLWVKEKVQKQDFLLLFFCGLFGVALNQGFFFLGLKLTQPIHASLIITSTPILVLIISAFYLKEPLTWRRIWGIALGLTGATLLIFQGQKINFNSSQMLGDLFILINAIAYGSYLVLVKSLLLKYHPFTVLKWILAFGALIVLPFGYKDLVIIEWGSIPLYIWLSIVYVLIFTTFFAYLLNAFALQTVSPTIVSYYIYLQPVIASIIAILLSKDHLDIIKILSAILIFAGVYVVSTGLNVKKQENEK